MDQLLSLDIHHWLQHCLTTQQTKSKYLMNFVNLPSVSSDLLVAERDILTRVARGGPLKQVLHDIILLCEKPSNGEMKASILLTSEDGKHLVEGAAPSLPLGYNQQIDGIPIGNGIGSCGTAAFVATPVIVTDIEHDPLWKDFRDLALSHNLRACWSMPVQAADGSVIGTFANYYHEPKEPTERDLEIIAMVTRTTAVAIERYRHELARERAEEQRQLLIGELNHRVKNLFTLGTAILKMSARSAKSVEDYASAVEGRFLALSRAHQITQPSTTIGDRPSLTLQAIIEDVLAPYVEAGSSDKVKVIGLDTVEAPADKVTSLAMIFHELATNAAKYGVLAQSEGQLLISCSLAETFRILWREQASREVAPPGRSGFGSTLIKRTVEGFGGHVRYDWSGSGVAVSIELPRTFLN